MITMMIRYKGENGNAKRFAEEMRESGTVDLIRKEEGNLRYEYYYSAEDPETVLLIDSWKDEKALEIHHASQMMNTITALREKYDIRMEAERYTDEIVPESDERFIRR